MNPATTSSPSSAQGYVDDARNDDVLVYVDGEFVPRNRAVVSVFDSGFVLGDGALNYGLEQICELYYRFQLEKYVQLSPDFQYIQNPGFNQDLGPVRFYSVRAHLEY